MKILGIDTSGKIASVALSDNGKILGEISFFASQTHSQVILPLVKELLDRVGVEIEEIDCIAVSEGPGSYTGLRIGISVVKGLCFNGKTKCMGISTLRSLAQNVSMFEGVVIPVMKARNRLDYVGAYLIHNGVMKEYGEESLKSYDDILGLVEDLGKNCEDFRIMLVGDDSENLKEELFKKNDRVTVAPMSFVNQKASSLCEIAQKDAQKWIDCEKLEAKYLQITKAEKDLKEGIK